MHHEPRQFPVSQCALDILGIPDPNLPVPATRTMREIVAASVEQTRFGADFLICVCGPRARRGGRLWRGQQFNRLSDGGDRPSDRARS